MIPELISLLLYFNTAKNTHIDVTMREPEGWIAFPFGQSTEPERYLSQLFDLNYGPYNLKFLWTVVCNESDVIMATIMLVTLYNHPVLTTDKKDSLAVSYMGSCMRVPTRSDTNRSVQSKKKAGSLKFRI